MFRKRLKKLCQFNFKFEFSFGDRFFKKLKYITSFSFSDQFCTIIDPFWQHFDTFQTLIGSNKIEWGFCLAQNSLNFILFIESKITTHDENVRLILSAIQVVPTMTSLFGESIRFLTKASYLETSFQTCCIPHSLRAPT